MKDCGVDCFLAQAPVTMGYLHGFYESGHERFMTLAVSAHAEVRLICPALSESQAKRAGIQDVRGWKDGENPLALFEQLASDWCLRSAIIAVDDEMPAQMLLKMQSALPAALFRPGQAVLAELMRRKEPGELDEMRRAGHIADEAFEAVKSQIHPGMTERQVSTVLGAEMARRGGEPAFAIVATGANSAEPHHLSDDTVLSAGDVLILDFGCTVNGYYSDITRTVGVGRVSQKAHEVYGIVYRAHRAGRDAIRAGVTAGSVDSAARQVIEEAGYGPQFFHRTGHGIGMRGHEEPFIIGDSQEVLEPGNCFSIEPGIYLAGEFGVRIENIVAATESGHESMNAEPSPTLIELS